MSAEDLAEAARRTLDGLKATRRAHEGEPVEEVRRRIQENLRQTLETLPESAADELLGRLREAIVQEARERQERLEQLESEVRKLETDNGALRRERDAMSQQLAASASGGGGSSKDALTRVWSALRQVSVEGGVTDGSVTLSREDVELIQLIQMLYQFAVQVSTNVQRVVKGSDPDAGNTIVDQYAKEIGKRFNNFLDRRPGALDQLKEVLARNGQFPQASLNAHMSSVRAGTKTLLDQLDPKAIADKNRGPMGGIKFEQAWKELANIHSDIAALPPAERWETYFQPPYHNELARVFEGKSSKS